MWWIASALAGPGLVDGLDVPLDDVASDFALPGVPTPEVDPRPIVNGSVDTSDDFPATVFLQIFSDTAAGSCSGTLIHPDYIITAAHCLIFEDGSTARQVRILFGVGGNLGFIGERAGASYAVHPDYDGIVANSPDIAVVEMNDSVRSIESVAVNDEPMSSFWEGIELELVGYGIVGDGLNGTGGVRRTADSLIRAVDSIFVTTEDPEQNLCQGDSGGPMYRSTADGLELIGVNSFVTGGCVGVLSSATRVDAFLAWLEGEVPELRLSAADPPLGVPRPLDAAVGPNVDPPTIALPEWEEPTVPSRGLYSSFPPSCAHAPAPIGALGLLALAAFRRRRQS
ncbi:MAG: S1 family peptidase [Myxococcota bacterium]